LDEYTELFLASTVYLDIHSSELDLTDDEIDLIKNLRGKFEELGKDRGVYVIVDCEGLLGQDLIDKINSYLNIIKIAIPILLIGLGVIDFTKAIFAGDDGEMKKAQQNFMKRIFIAVLIFLVPTVLNLILQLANHVWPIIEPSNCGVFE